jgi:glycosyltransferase involved in cell wall biosynthesis
MTIGFFLWDIDSVKDVLLSILQLLITSSWIYLFIVSLKSHFVTPIIIQKQKRKTLPKYLEKMRRNRITKYSRSGIYNPLPLVSVIVSARNEEAHIEKCLSSLLAQSYPNLEVIAIDDNSTDATLRIMKDIKRTRHMLPLGRLKIISLNDKPGNWNGKTWASQQGYLQSCGSLLLFTDADTEYTNKDTILLTVSYMQEKNFDVLTGIPYLELRDFWSRIVMPLWNLFSEVFGASISDVINPKSNVAYLMGSFFMIRRRVFEDVGTFQSVCNSIQEDKALGMRIKKAGYDINIVKVDEIVSALWSRDLTSLWHGIGRSLAHIAIESRSRLVKSLLIIFMMAAFPFLVLPYTVLITVQQIWLTYPSEFLFIRLILLLFLNILSCLLVITGTAIKAIKKYRLTPAYSILSFIGAMFLIVAYLTSIIPLMMSIQTRPVIWRGRTYIYNVKRRRVSGINVKETTL